MRLSIWLNAKHFSEIWFARCIQPTEIKADSSRNFTCVSLTDSMKNIKLLFINSVISIYENYAKRSVLFQANVITTILCNLWNIHNHPWLWCAWSFHLIIFWSWINKNLWMNIDKLENALIIELFSVIFKRFTFWFNNDKRWEFLYLIFLCNRFFTFSD